MGPWGSSCGTRSLTHCGAGCGRWVGWWALGDQLWDTAVNTLWSRMWQVGEQLGGVHPWGGRGVAEKGHARMRTANGVKPSSYLVVSGCTGAVSSPSLAARQRSPGVGPGPERPP